MSQDFSFSPKIDISTTTIQYREIIEGLVKRRIAFNEHSNLFFIALYCFFP